MSHSEFLESRGLKVWCQGNELRVAPPEKITPDIVDFIKTHKPEIMAKLKGDTTLPAIWHTPYPQGTPEARQESLLQCMGALCLKTRKAIEKAYKDRQYKATPDILAFERRLEVLQQSVLKGKANLRDFQKAADGWQWSAKAELN